MKMNMALATATLALFAFGVHLARSAEIGSLADQRATIYRQLKEVHHYTDAQIDAAKTIFEQSPYMGQGNPAVTDKPATPEECQEKLTKAGVHYENAAFEKICGDKYMAPLYDPARQKPEEATACIDQFEFPDIPCTYPVIWVKAREAAEICDALGKRICDAHEWEGACAGALLPPDYHWELARGRDPEAAIRAMRAAHNREAAATKSWSYGPTFRRGVCAQSGHKTPNCNGGSWTGCGSNHFPTGMFPDCHSTLDVYDLNGNAAEHMNLPLNESQMASRGSKELGYTEMKGSWFIWDQYQAHEDWCRWRAPFWHGTRVMAADSHSNYHLGFRCCKTIKPPPGQ
jgi:hypothetical protein